LQLSFYKKCIKMISKSTALFYFCFLLVHTVFAIPENLEDLRARYMIALHNHEKVEEVYKFFLTVEEPSAKAMAYKGALEAIMTKTTWNIFKKMSFLRDSEASFNQAIQKSPNDVEIRFMRLAVQHEIPEYVGFSKDMETDRKFIVNHIEEFNVSTLPQQTLSEILSFMKRCNRFTSDQIEKFRGILALKIK